MGKAEARSPRRSASSPCGSRRGRTIVAFSLHVHRRSRRHSHECSRASTPEEGSSAPIAMRRTASTGSILDRRGSRTSGLTRGATADEARGISPNSEVVGACAGSPSTRCPRLPDAGRRFPQTLEFPGAAATRVRSSGRRAARRWPGTPRTRAGPPGSMRRSSARPMSPTRRTQTSPVAEDEHGGQPLDLVALGQARPRGRSPRPRRAGARPACARRRPSPGRPSGRARSTPPRSRRPRAASSAGPRVPVRGRERLQAVGDGQAQDRMGLDQLDELVLAHQADALLGDLALLDDEQGGQGR